MINNKSIMSFLPGKSEFHLSGLFHTLKRFVLFHKKRHPTEMGEKEINQYITYLAVKGKVAASTQNQALCAILFLYKHVFKQAIVDLGEIEWARKPKKLPVVFTRTEQRRYGVRSPADMLQS